MEKKIVVNTTIVEEMAMSMSELCKACSVSYEYIIDLVDEGIIEPTIDEMPMNSSLTEIQKWYFTGTSMQRVLMTARLQKDLGTNLAGAGLMLELMEKK